ncbi:MAG TPA: hypothetical protein VFG86_04205 [Chloroflexota bacterium]|nr:hypothetical protein [Chloroflexota bacterium]
MVDLVELAGLWLAAEDRLALQRSLRRLIDVLAERYPDDRPYRQRFEGLLEQAETVDEAALRKSYRRATLG